MFTIPTGLWKNWEALKGLCADSAAQQPNAKEVLGKAPSLYLKEICLLILGRCSEEQGPALRGRRLAGTTFLLALCLAKAGRCSYFFFFLFCFSGGCYFVLSPSSRHIFVLSQSSIPKWQCLRGDLLHTSGAPVCMFGDLFCFFFGCHWGNSPWSPGSGGQGDCVYWVLRGRTCQSLAYNKPESRCWLRPSTMGN